MTVSAARWRVGVRALLPLLMVAMISGACRSSGAVPTRHLAGRATAPAGPTLTRLPESATYAWVEPASMIGYMTPRQVARSAERDIINLRGDVNVVLLSRGWREEPAAPEYELTFAVVDQPPDAGRSARGLTAAAKLAVLPVCTGSEVETIGSTCQMVAETPGSFSAELRRGPGAWLAYVIRRVEDDATFQYVVWVNPYNPPRDISLARPTLDLLLGAAARD